MGTQTLILVLVCEAVACATLSLFMVWLAECLMSRGDRRVSKSMRLNTARMIAAHTAYVARWNRWVRVNRMPRHLLTK